MPMKKRVVSSARGTKIIREEESFSRDDKVGNMNKAAPREIRGGPRNLGHSITSGGKVPDVPWGKE